MPRLPELIGELGAGGDVPCSGQVQRECAVVGDRRCRHDFYGAHRFGVRHQHVARVPRRLAVSGRAGVCGADELDEPDAPQHIEGLTVRQEVEIPADHGEVAVTSDLCDECGQLMRLVAPSRGVALTGWIAQTVQVHHGDGSFEARCGQAQRVCDARTTGDGPLFVLDVPPVNEGGRLLKDGRCWGDERSNAELLLMDSSVPVDDGARRRWR